MLEEKTKTLKEWQAYGALGLLVRLEDAIRPIDMTYMQAAIQCVKKQMSKEVKNINTDSYGVDFGDCPDCGCPVCQYVHKFCPECGRKLRWSDG